MIVRYVITTSIYTGATTVTAGTLALTGSASLPTSTAVSLSNGAVLDLSGQNQPQTIGSLSSADAATSVKLGTGTLTIGAPSGESFAGIISGAGGVIKTGEGAQTLSGVNTCTGPTAVNAGTLALTGSGAIGASAVTVSGGILAPGGIGAGDAANALGGTLAIGAGGTVHVDLAEPGSTTDDQIQVASTVTMGGTLSVSSLGTMAAGTYRIMTCSGTPSGSFATTNLPASFGGTVNKGAGFVDLVVFAVLGMGDVGGPFTYTGLARTPQPAVYYGATLLTLGVDYTLSYANNVNAGTATVTVTGIGSYSGTQVKNFTIAKATPTATLAVNNSPQPYNGTGLSATVGITASSVPGSVANILTGGAASQNNVGTYAVTADFVPTDTVNYSTLSALAAGSFQIQWSELILNTDGTINWTKYAEVAGNFNRRDIMDYRFGPRYLNYHPTPEAIPTMFHGSDRMGFHLGGWTSVPVPDMNWYSEGGQLAISPDADAPTKWQPGVAQCLNGGVWNWYAPTVPEYSLLNRLMFDRDVYMPNQGFSGVLPDPGPLRQSWIDTSGGSIPAPPVTVVRTRSRSGVTGYIIYKNGLIGVAGTGNEPYDWYVAGYAHRVCMKLPDGKVPTAAVVSGCNEFLFVTVWDSAIIKARSRSLP